MPVFNRVGFIKVFNLKRKCQMQMSPNDRQLGLGNSHQIQSQDIINNSTSLLVQGLMFLSPIEDNILCIALRLCAVKRFMVNCRAYDYLVLYVALKLRGHNDVEIFLAYLLQFCSLLLFCFGHVNYPCGNKPLRSLEWDQPCLAQTSKGRLSVASVNST